MADETAPANTLTAVSRRARSTRGDLPEAVRCRYYLEDRGGAITSFYVDAAVKTPAFRDRGRELAALRADPNVVRDMAVIARHRGWSIVKAQGTKAFRREAWLAGRALGLEVRGYRPTERDIQDLERRLSRQRPRHDPSDPAPNKAPTALDPAARSRLAVVERVVRDRITDSAAQQRVLAAARERIAHWLEQGARFDPWRTGRREAEAEIGRRRERQR